MNDDTQRLWVIQKFLSLDVPFIPETKFKKMIAGETLKKFGRSIDPSTYQSRSCTKKMRPFGVARGYIGKSMHWIRVTDYRKSMASQMIDAAVLHGYDIRGKIEAYSRESVYKFLKQIVTEEDYEWTSGRDNMWRSLESSFGSWKRARQYYQKRN